MYNSSSLRAARLANTRSAPCDASPNAISTEVLLSKILLNPSMPKPAEADAVIMSPRFPLSVAPLDAMPLNAEATSSSSVAMACVTVDPICMPIAPSCPSPSPMTGIKLPNPLTPSCNKLAKVSTTGLSESILPLVSKNDPAIEAAPSTKLSTPSLNLSKLFDVLSDAVPSFLTSFSVLGGSPPPVRNSASILS